MSKFFGGFSKLEKFFSSINFSPKFQIVQNGFFKNCKKWSEWYLHWCQAALFFSQTSDLEYSIVKTEKDSRGHSNDLSMKDDRIVSATSLKGNLSDKRWHLGLVRTLAINTVNITILCRDHDRHNPVPIISNTVPLCVSRRSMSVEHRS